MNKNNSCMRLIFLFLCGLFLLETDASAAGKAVDVSRIGEIPVMLAPHLAFLEDASLALTLADVQSSEIAARFKVNNKATESLGFGYTRSAYWLRLTLTNTSSKAIDSFLEIDYVRLSSVQFHQPDASGVYQSLQTGHDFPMSTRPYQNRYFVFPITLPAQTTQVYYLRLQSPASLRVPARLWSPQAFHIHERDDYAIQSMYYAMAIAMLLFNLLLFIALRDKMYLLYVGFVSVMALSMATQNGLSKEYFWPDAGAWSSIANSVGYTAGFITLLIFMQSMIDTRKIIPRLNRVINVFIGINIIFMIGFFVSLPNFAKPSTLLALANALLILGTAIYCAFLRQRSAYFFLAAFLILVMGIIVQVLWNFGVLPINKFTENILQIGSAFDMLLLAFALADRYHMIRSKATEDVKLANASLEQRLQEREAELTASHLLLRGIEHRQTLSQERQRLMQDMHDGLGSSLTSALRVVEHGQMDEIEVAQVLKGCIDDLKLAIDSMEPVGADLLLLLATLRFRLGPRLESTGIALRWEVKDIPKLEWLDPKNALHILRILQEAFTNIIKHTYASEICVTTEAENDHVLVKVSDNGPGFSVQSAFKKGGKGLSNQKLRAEAIGAEVNWDSNNTGTCFTLRLPIKKQAV